MKIMYAKECRQTKSIPELRYLSFQLEDIYLKNIFFFLPDYALEFL